MKDLNNEFQTLDVQIKKIAQGECFVGRLTDKTFREMTDDTTGEIKNVPQYHFTGDDKSLFVFLGDKGFTNEMSLCNIKMNDRIKVTKGEKLQLSPDRYVNQYIIAKARL